MLLLWMRFERIFVLSFTRLSEVCVLCVESNISFDFVPKPRSHSSTATHIHPCPPIPWHVSTHVHPCYSNCAHVFKNHNITNNIAPMPTQNPWAWVGMGTGMSMGTQCRALATWSCLLWANLENFILHSICTLWHWGSFPSSNNLIILFALSTQLLQKSLVSLIPCFSCAPGAK